MLNFYAKTTCLVLRSFRKQHDEKNPFKFRNQVGVGEGANAMLAAISQYSLHPTTGYSGYPRPGHTSRLGLQGQLFEWVKCVRKRERKRNPKFFGKFSFKDNKYFFPFF